MAVGYERTDEPAMTHDEWIGKSPDKMLALCRAILTEGYRPTDDELSDLARTYLAKDD